MRLFYPSAFATLALCYVEVPPGALYISQIEDKTADQDLLISDGKLVPGNKMYTFQYDAIGTLKSVATAQYLSVDESGRLVLDILPNSGFLLTLESFSSSKRALSYNGVEVFELCQDNSIACKSKCAGARSILVMYQDVT
ncbi:hypothetical protein JCM33374_g6231 [Metschnikowia sp. JCM 33374]|nr:hypothetical protein JCM33374_g6231 [Metschnikowia sp. JCM 33374]